MPQLQISPLRVLRFVVLEKTGSSHRKTCPQKRLNAGSSSILISNYTGIRLNHSISKEGDKLC
jgi:hypothetical protein